jgi:signal transduction histidine kinase
MGGRSVQVSNVGGVRAPREPRIVFVAALACWAVGVVLYAALPEDSTTRYLAANAVYVAGAAFALVCMARATAGVQGKERLFWGLLAAGLVVWLVADLGWRGLQESAFGTQEVSNQHTAYLVSYLLLVCAMMLLVNWTTTRITLLTFLDALSIMLSVGVLIWYFFLGRIVAEAGSQGTWAILAVFSWPLFDAALLFLSLVVFSTAGRPPFTGLLAASFLAFALADGWYLGVRSGDAYGLAGWPDMFWALGLVFLGLAALRATPATPSLRSSITPWRVFAFWLSPLSPPLHLGFVLVWGAAHPPLPAYAALGAAILFFYLALRIALVSFVSRRLSRDQEEKARKVEQGRVLYELHDTVKQGVHGISLSLRGALDAERRGEHEAARRMLERALEVSQEAEYRVSQPYDELQAIHGEVASNPSDYLRQRLKRFEEYFGIETHDDFRVPFEFLRPAEVAAAQRVIVEASWNAVKHAQTRTLWLETRRVGSVVIVRVRDDGRGFDAGDPPPGLGLRYMRRRAEEVGAELDVISTSGRGTTVQLRFHNR